MSRHDGGKGDTPRPLGVPMEQFDSQWEKIFGKKKPEEVEEQKEENND
jgi:hypothetical protein